MEHPVYTIQGLHGITTSGVQLFYCVCVCVCVKSFAVKLALLRVLIVEVSSDAISCTAGDLHRELTVLLTKTVR